MQPGRAADYLRVVTDTATGEPLFMARVTDPA